MFGLWSWLTSWFHHFGFRNKQARLLFIGLDNAGKTTLLGRLKTGRMISAAPTHLPHSEEFRLCGITCTTFDLGGHEQARRVWRDYFSAVDAIIFIVDTCDLSKIPIAADEIQSILVDEELAACPILIFGNKIDKAGALSEVQLAAHLGVSDSLTGKNSVPTAPPGGFEGKLRPVELFMCSIVEECGYGDGFRWLAKQL